MTTGLQAAAWRTDWGGYLLLWVRMAFGSHSLISGLNHFVPFFDVGGGGDPALSPIGPFMDELMSTGIYDVVKLVEITVGVCLLANRFVPVAALIELPISAVIAWLCFVVDGSPNIVFSGAREIGFNLIILAFYGRYFLPLLDPRAKCAPIWKSERSNVL